MPAEPHHRGMRRGRGRAARPARATGQGAIVRELLRRRALRRMQYRLRVWAVTLDEIRANVALRQRRLREEFGDIDLDEPAPYSFYTLGGIRQREEEAEEAVEAAESAAEEEVERDRTRTEARTEKRAAAEDEAEEERDPRQTVVFSIIDDLVDSEADEPAMPQLARVNRELTGLGYERLTTRQLREYFDDWRERRSR